MTPRPEDRSGTAAVPTIRPPASTPFGTFGRANPASDCRLLHP